MFNAANAVLLPMSATANGGAIRGQIGSTLAMTNVTIDHCTAGESGGGLLSVGNLTITGSSFTSCQGKNHQHVSTVDTTLVSPI
jgi:hypothetical protein